MRRFALLLPLTICLVVGAVRAETPQELPAAIREVQESLGGPAVDQFPSLKPVEPSPAPTPSERRAPIAPTPGIPHASYFAGHPHVQALRRASRELVTTASELEDNGLYDYADALWEMASRMRAEARRLKKREDDIRRGFRPQPLEDRPSRAEPAPRAPEPAHAPAPAAPLEPTPAAPIGSP